MSRNHLNNILKRFKRSEIEEIITEWGKCPGDLSGSISSKFNTTKTVLERCKVSQFICFINFNYSVNTYPRQQTFTSRENANKRQITDNTLYLSIILLETYYAQGPLSLDARKTSPAWGDCHLILIDTQHFSCTLPSNSFMQ